MINILVQYLKAFALVSSVFLGGLYLGHRLIDNALAEKIDPYSSLRQLATILHRVQNDYVEEKSTEELVNSSIKGMVSKLDPHSYYLLEDEVRQKITKDEWSVGAGMELNSERIITRIFPKGPAAIAGLSVGDQILSINQKNAQGWSAGAIKKELTGNIGDQVQIEITRQKKQSVHTIVLDEVQAITLELTAISPGYVYARLERFSSDIGMELQEELQRFERQDGTSLKGILLDLRNNPGGGIAEGIQVLDLFLATGDLASVQYRDPSQNQSYTAVQSPSDLLKPKLVVLVNSLSASAAELVAGTLQYHKRAVLVGEPTFGKGSVQKIYQFDQSTLKLTVGRYLLPNGQAITTEKPIIPDIEIALPTLAPKQELNEKIKALNISPAEKKNMLDLLSQLPENQYRPAIVWHKDFQQRCAIDPQLAAAWKNLSSK